MPWDPCVKDPLEASMPAALRAESWASIALEGALNRTKAVISQGKAAVSRMEVDEKPQELLDSHKEFINIVKEVSGSNWKVGSIERQSFYEEAKKSYAIVTTTDARPFSCFVMTKGVIKPDGSVWVLDK